MHGPKAVSAGPFAGAFKIGPRWVGDSAPVLIIAEAGVSHFGDVGKALALVDLAVDSGADVFKIQVFNTERLVSSESQEWRRRLRSRELTHAEIGRVKSACDGKGILFLATAHEEEAIEYLDRDLDVRAFKIGSGEVENWSFIRNAAGRGKPIILSTGMYEMEQVALAARILADRGCWELAILHCVTLYPAAPRRINLRVMETISSFFPGPVGYSDHTVGTAVPLAAVARGARVVEKHITIDVNVPDAQDWKVSCTPETFPRFVEDVRAIEMALGDGVKEVSDEEKASRAWARKSLFAAHDIPRGSVLREEMVVSMRPGTGLSPAELDRLLGREVARDIRSGAAIREEDLHAA